MKKQQENKGKEQFLNQKGSVKRVIKNYFSFRSSIYARVVYIIAILSVFLFISYSVIFKSVYEGYLRTVIRQRGDNIGSIIEGSLYYSMLKKDWSKRPKSSVELDQYVSKFGQKVEDRNFE